MPSLPPHLCQTPCLVAEGDGGTREAKRCQVLKYELSRVVCSVSTTHEILTWVRRWMMCSGVQVDTEYCVWSPFYDSFVLSESLHRRKKKTYFQRVAVERKRNISHLSKRNRKVLMCNSRCSLHSSDLAFPIHNQNSLQVLCMQRRNLQMQLHCTIWILQGPKGQLRFLSNKSLPKC